MASTQEVGIPFQRCYWRKWESFVWRTL